MTDLHERLIADLDATGASYRLIEHEPEGRTEIVSGLHGNALAHTAKCIVVMVKVGKKQTHYVLAVVPGDARVDLNAVKTLYAGTYASFAAADRAEELAGSVSGTVLPFSYDERLDLVVDPTLLEPDELYFNAARLDRSLALNTSDYTRIAKPRVERIVESAKETPDRVLPHD